MGLSGLEPPTLRLSVVRSSQLSYKPSSPHAPYRSQPRMRDCSFTSLCLLFLAQTHRWFVLGVRRSTSGGDSRDRTGDLLLARQALSQLSYIPFYLLSLSGRVPSKLNNEESFKTPADLRMLQRFLRRCGLLRKEVIQPLVLERLPCYDFTPIIEPTFGRAPS